MNPPRKGLDPAVRDRLLALRPRELLYLSCNPRTLARDAAELGVRGGYGLEPLQPMDFLPHTAHVETLAVFRRG